MINKFEVKLKYKFIIFFHSDESPVSFLLYEQIMQILNPINFSLDFNSTPSQYSLIKLKILNWKFLWRSVMKKTDGMYL